MSMLCFSVKDCMRKVRVIFNEKSTVRPALKSSNLKTHLKFSIFEILSLFTRDALID